MKTNSFSLYKIPLLLTVALHLLLVITLLGGLEWQTKRPRPTKSLSINSIEARLIQEPPPKAAPQKAKPNPQDELKRQAVKKALLKKKQERIRQKQLQEKKKKAAEQKAKKQAQETKRKALAKLKAAQEKKLKAEKKKREQINHEEKQLREQRKQLQQERAAARKKEMKQQQQREKVRQERDRLAKERRATEAAETATIESKYITLIKNKVKNNWRLQKTMDTKLSCRVRVELIPGGDVISVAIVESSGDPGFDHSVERAVQKSSPLPFPTNPRHFARFRIIEFLFSPRDF